MYVWVHACVCVCVEDAAGSNAGMWECPDFFNAINDTKGRWVLKYSAGGDWYRIGSYDAEHDVSVVVFGLQAMQESITGQDKD